MKLAVVVAQLAVCALFFFLSDVAQGAPVAPNVVELEKIFEEYDIDGDGKLSEDEMKQAVKKTVQKYDDSKFNLLMTVAPKTDDGKICFGSFRHVIWILMTKDELVDWDLLHRFSGFDEDGDRLLSARELNRALGFLELGTYGEKEIEYMMDTLWDENKDGKLDFSEFMRAVHHIRTAQERRCKVSDLKPTDDRPEV